MRLHVHVQSSEKPQGMIVAGRFMVYFSPLKQVRTTSDAHRWLTKPEDRGMFDKPEASKHKTVQSHICGVAAVGLMHACLVAGISSTQWTALVSAHRRFARGICFLGLSLSHLKGSVLAHV